MRVVTQNFVAAGKPYYIRANAGVLYLDITDGTRYRQTTIPYGQNWVEIEDEQIFIPSTAVGTVTSVALNVPSPANPALGVSGSPVTTSGTLQITALGNTSQYIRGDGSLATFPAGGGTVTSVSASVPSPASPAYSVTVANPSTTPAIAITANGATSDYVRGDGSYAPFPAIPVVTPSALTRTNDTNVTLTLGGSPSVALLAATSITVGWTGTLGISRGGTGLGTAPANGQILIGNGTSYVLANITAGTGISISNGSGTITITNTSPASGVTITGRQGDVIVSGTSPTFQVSTVVSPFLLMGG